MAQGTSRGGFTLVELMITSVISAVILGAVVSSFFGGIRLLKATFATAEMSLRARDLRDRLLFHAAPTHDNTVWAGLLSGTNSADVLEANATKILMHCAAMKWPHRWLHPGGLNLLADCSATAPLAWARNADNTEDHSRFYIHLTGRTDVAGLSVEHNERIVVSVFGRQQITRTDGKGGLDK